MTETSLDSKDKFIGFVDVLGWKKFVEAAEAGTGLSLAALVEAAGVLGKATNLKHLKKHGPSLCPESKYIQRDLDFQITQVTDCVIVSSEVSPAGVINLVGHCWSAVLELLTKGIMCRGYITRGNIYHKNITFIGTGYQNACHKEKNEITAFKRTSDEIGTPFVEIDPTVCDYVESCEDLLVKKMFFRMVEGDGVVKALYPFKRLGHSFMISGLFNKFDPDKEKRSNNNVRQSLQKFKEKIIALVDTENPRAVLKGEHYIAALDAQLKQCDETDELIDKLSSPIPANRR